MSHEKKQNDSYVGNHCSRTYMKDIKIYIIYSIHNTHGHISRIPLNKSISDGPSHIYI